MLDEGFGFSYIDTEVEKQVLENIELDLDDSKEVSDII